MTTEPCFKLVHVFQQYLCGEAEIEYDMIGFLANVCMKCNNNTSKTGNVCLSSGSVCDSDHCRSIKITFRRDRVDGLAVMVDRNKLHTD